VKEILKKNISLNKTERSTEKHHVLRLLRERKKLKINNFNILIRKTSSCEQIVIPSSLHWLVFQEFHQNMAHLGATRTYQLARERFYWPNMEEDIKTYISKKCSCLISRKPHVIPYAPLGTVTATSPLDIVSLDFLKVDKSAGGYEYILVIVDQFTRYAQAYATRNKSSRTAAEKLFNNFVTKFGPPKRILHDQGGEFENNLFKELEKYYGIKKSRTTPYHPMCNGMTERLNSTIIQMLRSLPETAKSKWRESLDKLMFAYNCTRHAVTGYSPFYLLFGRNARLPIDAVLDQYKTEKKQYTDVSDYVRIQKSRMNEAFQIAQNNTSKRRDQDKKLKDTKATLTPLEVGDRVLVRNLTQRGGTGKLRSFWEEKVYLVLEQKDQVGLVYAVREEENQKGKIRVLHRNNILSCNEFPSPNSVNLRNDQVRKIQYNNKQVPANHSRRVEDQQVEDYPAYQIDYDSDESDENDNRKVYFLRRQVSNNNQQNNRELRHSDTNRISNKNINRINEDQINVEEMQSSEQRLPDRTDERNMEVTEEIIDTEIARGSKGPEIPKTRCIELTDYSEHHTNQSLRQPRIRNALTISDYHQYQPTMRSNQDEVQPTTSNIKSKNKHFCLQQPLKTYNLRSTSRSNNQHQNDGDNQVNDGDNQVNDGDNQNDFMIEEELPESLNEGTSDCTQSSPHVNQVSLSGAEMQYPSYIHPFGYPVYYYGYYPHQQQPSYPINHALLNYNNYPAMYSY